MSKLLNRYAARAVTITALVGGCTAVTAPAVAAVPAGGLTTPAVVEVSTGTLTPITPYAGTASITFAVTAEGQRPARHNVQACTAVGDAAFTCGKATTTSVGKLTLRRANITGPVRFKLVVPATPTTQAAESAVVQLRPQVGVKVTRKSGTATVVVKGHASQYLVLKRQEKNQWVFVSLLQVSGPVTSVTGLATGKKYQVVVSDTTGIRGATSTAF